jgi:hypothetical protein
MVAEGDPMIEVRPGGRRRIDRVLGPDYVANLDRLDLAEVRARRDDAAQEETDLSYLRRLLHARIDIVRAEKRRRSEDSADSAPVVEQLALEPSRAEAHRRHVEALVSDADLSDVTSLPAERLDLALDTYAQEESSVSQRRREVQRVMDLLNDEIAGRYRKGTASVDELLAAERTRDADQD